MINKKNIEKAREILSKEFNENMKEMLGKKEFEILCNAMGELDVLLNKLNKLERYKKVDEKLSKILKNGC